MQIGLFKDLSNLAQEAKATVKKAAADKKAAEAEKNAERRELRKRL